MFYKKPVFVTGVEQLKNLKDGDTAILGGDIVVLSMTSLEIDKSCEQPARSCSPFSLNPSRSKKIYVYLEESIPAFMDENPGIRFVLAVDIYLKIGAIASILSKSTQVLFGGGLNESSLNVEVYTFKKGRVISVKEQVFKSTNRLDSDLADSLDQQCRAVRDKNSNARFFWVAPLPAPIQTFVTEFSPLVIKESFFSTLSLPLYRSVKRGNEGIKKNSIWHSLKYVVLLLLPIVCYMASVLPNFMAYRQAISEYDAIPVEIKKQYNSGMNLKQIAYQKIFLNRDRPGINHYDLGQDLIRLIASMDGVLIKTFEIKLNPQYYKNEGLQGNFKGLFRVSISVPLKASQDALTQSKFYAERISKMSGLPVILENQYRTTDSKLIPSSRRIFTFVGKKEGV